ncbi:MAG: putative porin [bacterium]
MKRFALSLLACMVLGCTVAWAGSAYDDVSTDHWAYNALDYLTHRGVLEGYPDGFFKGDRTLTRYEFAQAIARLLDTVGEGSPDDINIMAETLRAEFSDQLAGLSGRVDNLGNQVQDMNSTIMDLEGSVADNTSRIGDLEGKVKDLKPGPEWKGELRYRWQFEDWADRNRFRQRIRFKLGYSKQINDCVKLAWQFQTQTGNDATSGNHTLGNQGRTADIFLHEAYVKYSPGWFGYYQDCEKPKPTCGGCGGCNECAKCEDLKCECKSKLDIYAGIYPNILTDEHEMVLDGDVNLQGLGMVYHFNQDFQLTSVASIFVEKNGSDYFDDDTYFFATELRHNDFLFDGLDAWFGSYGWKNENQLLADYFEGNGLVLADGSVFDFNGDGTVNGLDRFNSNFSVLKAGLQYTWDCAWDDKPLKIFGEYMMACDSDAEDNIAIVNQGLASPIIYESSDDTGWVAGAQWGDKPKDCGDWFTFARYKEIGANTIPSGLGDSDTGGANRNSFEWHWAYVWAPNCTLGVTYILSKMHNAYGFQIPNSLDDRQTIQVDWVFKF